MIQTLDSKMIERMIERGIDAPDYDLELEEVILCITESKEIIANIHWKIKREKSND